MDIYIFKVKDYTTILVGQMELNEFKEKVFYIQRGDGEKHKYDEYRIEWFRHIGTVDLQNK